MDPITLRRDIWARCMKLVKDADRPAFIEYLLTLIRLVPPHKWAEAEGPVIPYDRDHLAFNTGHTTEDVSDMMKRMHAAGVVIARKEGDDVVIDLSPIREAEQ